MFRLTKPSPDVLQRFLDEQRSQRFTYDAVGATAARDLPAGFHHDRHETDLGADEGDRFAQAWEAVRHLGAAAGRRHRDLSGHPGGGATCPCSSSSSCP